MDKINNININKTSFRGKIPSESIEHSIKKTLEKLFERAQREVVEYGEFKTVQECLKNTDKNLKIGDISLEITPSAQKTLKAKTKRIFRVRVYDEQGIDNYHAMFESGKKEEVLSYLKKSELIEEIKIFLDRASKSLNEY